MLAGWYCSVRHPQVGSLDINRRGGTIAGENSPSHPRTDLGAMGISYQLCDRFGSLFKRLLIDDRSSSFVYDHPNLVVGEKLQAEDVHGNQRERAILVGRIS